MQISPYTIFEFADSEPIVGSEDHYEVHRLQIVETKPICEECRCECSQQGGVASFACWERTNRLPRNSLRGGFQSYYRSSNRIQRSSWKSFLGFGGLATMGLLPRLVATSPFV